MKDEGAAAEGTVVVTLPAAAEVEWTPPQSSKDPVTSYSAQAQAELQVCLKAVQSGTKAFIIHPEYHIYFYHCWDRKGFYAYQPM